MMIYKAQFDFRNPQEQPEEDGKHQFMLTGLVEKERKKMIIRCDDDEGTSYRVEGVLNQVSAFGGEDIKSEVKASWAKIGSKRYVGRWTEGGVEYLFAINVGAEINKSK